MTHATTRVRLLGLGLLLAAAFAVPGVASADTAGALDCAPGLPLEKAVESASLVFVGRVTDVANEGRSATVEVTEVWRGEVPTPVLVQGGFDPSIAAEDDRSFEVGVTYLFLPTGLDGLASAVVVDSLCSPTTPWTDDLARLRPAEVGTPISTEPSTTGLPTWIGDLVGPLAVGGLLGGGAFVLALVVAQRRES